MSPSSCDATDDEDEDGGRRRVNNASRFRRGVTARGRRRFFRERARRDGSLDAREEEEEERKEDDCSKVYKVFGGSGLDSENPREFCQGMRKREKIEFNWTRDSNVRCFRTVEKTRQFVRFEIEKDRWAVCESGLRRARYARIVCEDVCEGRLVYLDGVKVGGKEGTSMMERAVEKMRRDVLKHEMERKRNAEERNTRERFSQRDREEKYSESETISGVHYELPKEETEHIKSLFRKFDAIYASANDLQTRLRKSLCANASARESARARRRDALKTFLSKLQLPLFYRSYTYSYLPHSLSSSFFYPFSPYFSITSVTRFAASSIESLSSRHSSSVNRMVVVA